MKRHRHVPALSTIGLLALAVVFAPLPSRADVQAIDPVGRPKRFEAGKKTAVAVWFENGTWHLRATTGERMREVISGRVTVQGGRVVSGRLEGLEDAGDGKDANKKGKKGRKARKAEKKDDDLAVLNDGAAFEFRFINGGQSDGLSFKVSDQARTVTFNFRAGGDDDPKQIVIGAAGAHPDKVPFVLTARPVAK